MFGAIIADLASHTALTQKRNICDRRKVILYADCWYMAYSFCVMHELFMKKEQKKKEEQNRKLSHSIFSIVR